MASDSVKEVREAFLEGTLEIYQNMMTDELSFYLLDTEDTSINIYGEAITRKYKDPIKLWGKIVVERNPDGEVDFDNGVTKCTITIPTQDFILKGIDYSPKNYNTLRQGVFEYKGVTYQIDEINPTTMVADEFIFHKFSCSEVKIDFLAKE